jgi:hypothetical protein
MARKCERAYPKSRIQRNLRQDVATALGYYNVPSSITKELGESKVLLGDGIDDIVDILLDLKGVLWRLDNTSVDDALWDLNQGFQYHWGLHLRDLQLYLHVLASGMED